MNCLGIFAKYPEMGRVKTRLAKETSAEWAAAVARGFLLDTLERLVDIPARRLLLFSPASAGEEFARLAGDRFELEPQGEGDLGRRLHAFFARQRDAGYRRMVAVGADSPTLPVEWIGQAFDLLEGADVVLGPATDGGYYLLGCGQRLPPIFEGILWSGPEVLRQTIDRLADPSWRVALLPPWYDVDTLADWHTLTGHITAMRRAGRDPRVPHTERLFLTPPPKPRGESASLGGGWR